MGLSKRSRNPRGKCANRRLLKCMILTLSCSQARLFSPTDYMALGGYFFFKLSQIIIIIILLFYLGGLFLCRIGVVMFPPRKL